MRFFPIYLIYRFFYRVYEFSRHWYVRSVKMYWTWVIDHLEIIDYSLAWKITLKNLFKPLYKDYSVVGYILGFIFRLGRLCITSVFYAIIFVIAMSIYLVWLFIPAFIVLQIIINL